MTPQMQTQKESGRGFWYENAENGQILLCFKVKLHGRRFVRKLELPNGVKELRVRDLAIER